MDSSAQGGVATAKGGHGDARHRLEGHIPFIGSELRVLRRCIREAGVVLISAAGAQLDQLPEQFLDFVANPDSYNTIRAAA